MTAPTSVDAGPVLNRTTPEDYETAKHWAYAMPAVSPSNPHADGTEHFAAHALTLKLLDDAAAAAASIRADGLLTPEGKRQRFTAEVTAKQLPPIHAFRQALEADAARIENDVAALLEAADSVAVTDHATATERHERLALAQAFAQLTGQARQAALEGVVRGEDPQLASALAYVHTLITGIPKGMRDTLRGDHVAARVDQEQLHEFRLEAHRLGVSLRLVKTAEEALFRASDLDKLAADGLLPQRPATMTAAEKVAYVQAHGAGAFAALTDRFQGL